MAPKPLDLRLALTRHCLVLVLGWAPACADQQETGTLVHEDGARPPRDHALLHQLGASTLVALDPAGVVRFIDVASGAEPTALLLRERGGPVDVSAWHDAGPSHLTVLEQEDGEQSGALSLYRFQDPFFGRRHEGGSHEGGARTLAIPQGAVVFHEGPRWALAGWAGPLVPSVACGRPRSLLGIETSGAETTIRALAFAPDAGASLLHVTLNADGFVDCDSAPLVVKGGASPSVRAVELAPGGAQALVDTRTGRVAVGSLQHGKMSVLQKSSVAALSIEHVVPWRRGDRGGVVVLGSKPPSLIAIELDASRSQLEIVAEARALLSGSVTRATAFFSRDLVEVSGLFFVATSNGLEAFELVLEDEVIALDVARLDPFYADLEGPLLALPALD